MPVTVVGSQSDRPGQAPPPVSERAAVIARWPLLCVAVAWGLACLPLWIHGFPHGHDASYELFRIAGYRNALADGQWPPYWGGDFFVGYGSPIYLFYAPAFMTFASAFSWLTDSLLSGATISASLFLLAATAASYCAARAACDPLPESTRHEVACLTATLFVLHPYTLGTLYLRNALAEFAAICLFPLILWSALQALQVSRTGATRAVIATGLSLAALTLTHNLSALVGAAFFVATALALGVQPGRLPGRPHGRARVRSIGSRLMVPGGGLLLGLALSAYFWVPALGYSDLTRTSVELRHGKLDFHNNFVPFFTNFGLTEFYGAGPLTLVGLVAGAAYPGFADRPGPWRPRLRVVLSTFAVLLLALQFQVTTPLWESVPFLPLVQFPFRFLGPLGFIGALGLSCALAVLVGRASPARWRLVSLAVLLVAAAQASAPLSRARGLPTEVTAQFERAARPEAIRDNPGAMATFRWEYIPPLADRELWKRDPRYQGALHRGVGPITTRVIEDAPRRIALDAEVTATAVQSTAPQGVALAAVVVRRWWFPGWRARLDGASVPVDAAPDGLVAVGVPAGRHRVNLSLGPPMLRQLGLAVSLCGALAIIVLAVVTRRRRTRPVR